MAELASALSTDDVDLVDLDRVYPGPPLEVELGRFDNHTGEPSLEDALELLLDEGRFVVGDEPDYALTGSIERESARYRIEVQVVELATGDLRAEAEDSVSDKTRIASTMEALSAELRRELARGGI